MIYSNPSFMLIHQMTLIEQNDMIFMRMHDVTIVNHGSNYHDAGCDNLNFEGAVI